MSTLELEQKLKDSEEVRRKVEEEKNFKKLGLPSPIMQKLTSSLQKIEETKQDFSKTLPPETFKTVAEIFEVAASQLKTIMESKEFKLEIDTLIEKAESFDTAMQSILDAVEKANDLLTDLDQKLSLEFKEREKIRQKQREVIDKLNQYLEDWV